MKKVLIPFDGMHFSQGAFHFAKRLNELSPILLTALFVPQTNYANLWSYSSAMTGQTFVPLLEDEEAVHMEKNIEKFESLCSKYGIECSVHKNVFNFALPELKKETLFTDLVIIGSESFYEDAGTEKPNDYLKDALHVSGAPLVVVPEQFIFPKRNILAYDGSKSSVYAIKQFAYLFPEFALNETLLLYVSDDVDAKIPQEGNIEELVVRHFPNLTVQKLALDQEAKFAKWIEGKKDAMLVSGAFSRSGVSRMFRKSFINDVISEHRLPIFIAHN